MSCASCLQFSHRIAVYEAERVEIAEESEAIYSRYCQHQAVCKRLKKKYNALKHQLIAYQTSESSNRLSLMSIAEQSVSATSKSLQTESCISNKHIQVEVQLTSTFAQTEIKVENRACVTEIATEDFAAQTEDQGSLPLQNRQFHEERLARALKFQSKVREVECSAGLLGGDWADLRKCVLSEFHNFSKQLKQAFSPLAYIVTDEVIADGILTETGLEDSQSDLNFSESAGDSPSRGFRDSSCVNYAELNTRQCSPICKGPLSNSDTFTGRSYYGLAFKTRPSEDLRSQEGDDSVLVDKDVLLEIISKKSQLHAEKDIHACRLGKECSSLNRPPPSLGLETATQTEPDLYSAKLSESELEILALKSTLADSQEQVLKFSAQAMSLVTEIKAIKQKLDSELHQKKENEALNSQSEMLSNLFVQNKSLIDQLSQSDACNRQLEFELKGVLTNTETLRRKVGKYVTANKLLKEEKEQLLKEVIRLQGCCIDMQHDRTQSVSKVSELELALLTKEYEASNMRSEIGTPLHSCQSSLSMLDLIHNQSLTLRSQLEFFKELCLAKETRSLYTPQYTQTDYKSTCTAERQPSQTLSQSTLKETDNRVENTDSIDALKQAELDVLSLTQENAELVERLKRSHNIAEADTQTDLCSAAEELAEENKALRDRMVALKRLYSKELLKSNQRQKEHSSRKFSEETSDSFDLVEHLA